LRRSDTKPIPRLIRRKLSCFAIFIRSQVEGKIELRGRAPGKYRVTDYVHNREPGELDAASPTLDTEFQGSLLLQTARE
jgi:hypothetical protein